MKLVEVWGSLPNDVSNKEGNSSILINTCFAWFNEMNEQGEMPE
jgi:hypothetical protein